MKDVMIKNHYLDGLDDIEASCLWKVTAIGLGVVAAQAAEYLKTKKYPSVECYAFPTICEGGFVLTTELNNQIALSDILVIAVGNEEALHALSKLAEMSSELGVTSMGLVSLPRGEQDDSVDELKLSYSGLTCLDALIPVWTRHSADLKSSDASSKPSSDSKLSDVLCDLVAIITLKECFNLDYADIRKLLRFRRNCAYGMGFAEGASAAAKAMDVALEDIQVQIDTHLKYLGVLIYVRAGYELTMMQLDDIFNRFAKRVDHDTEILFGLSFVESMKGQLACSVLATGMP